MYFFTYGVRASKQLELLNILFSYDLRPGTDTYVYGLLKIGGYELLHDIRHQSVHFIDKASQLPWKRIVTKFYNQSIGH
ncbi:hypothetical protein MUK42_36175 [Musa troglodytarum]|uniref:Uncharacterized protein n=1 Tax=Musa troglodytarum TaxID=320322 RepID=A0A9E7ED78_9LILI|nr:hypothetical protein MUK42_36175 [Musa troglodytarum]